LPVLFVWVWRGACAWTTPATLCSGVPAVVWRAMVAVDGMLERHSSNQHWRKNPVILSGSATAAGISHASLTLKTVGMADLLDGVKSDANRTFDYLNGALGGVAEAGAGRTTPTDAANTCLDADTAWADCRRPPSACIG